MTILHEMLNKILAEAFASGTTDDLTQLQRRLTRILGEETMPGKEDKTSAETVMPREKTAAKAGRPMTRSRKMKRCEEDSAPLTYETLPMLSCRSLREERRLTEFEEEIMFMEARRISIRKIQQSLKEVHGTDIPVERIARITEELGYEIRRWKTRTLNRVYPVVYLDGFQSSEEHESGTPGFLTYSAVGVSIDGVKDVLGIWVDGENPENLGDTILSELKKRGVEDIIYIFVDRVSLFRTALTELFPETIVHTSVPGLVRDSLNLVPCVMRRELTAELRAIFHAATLPEAECRLREMAERRFASTPPLAQLWRDNWEAVARLFSYPPEVRRSLYQQYVMESLNSALRKILRKKKLFQRDEALYLAFFLSLHIVTKKWSIAVKDWSLARRWILTRFGARLSPE